MKLSRYRCLRCQAEWVPRIATKPKQCPSCKSLSWQKPKTIKKETRP